MNRSRLVVLSTVELAMLLVLSGFVGALAYQLDQRNAVISQMRQEKLVQDARIMGMYTAMKTFAEQTPNSATFVGLEEGPAIGGFMDGRMYVRVVVGSMGRVTIEHYGDYSSFTNRHPTEVKELAGEIPPWVWNPHYKW